MSPPDLGPAPVLLLELEGWVSAAEPSERGYESRMCVRPIGRRDGERVTDGGVRVGIEPGETPRLALDSIDRSVNVDSPPRVRPDSPGLVDKVVPDPTRAEVSNSTLRLCSGCTSTRGDPPLSTRTGHRCTLRKNPLMIPNETNRRGSIPSARTSCFSTQSCTVVPGTSFVYSRSKLGHEGET